MNYFIGALKQYADFSGRARRSEYWYFVLCSSILMFVVALVDGMITGGLLAGLLSLALIIPQLSVTIRRLHDTGRSGWWYFIQLVPFIGWIWFLVLLCTEGTTGPNQYGEDPKFGSF